MNFDVIIVGAGLSGSYLARKIKGLGLNTLIIEEVKVSVVDFQQNL